MTRVILVGPSQRSHAKALIDRAPAYAVVTIKERTRTDEQNALFWSMLEDIRKARPMGIVETKDGWKALVMHAAGHEIEFMQGLDGRPFPTGFRSSKLTVAQMRELIEWMYAFGAEHGVVWSEPKKEEAA
jgi:hypothetical protein